MIGAPELTMEINDGSTIADLLSVLFQRFGEGFKRETGNDLNMDISRNFNVYLEGRLIYPADYSETILRDNDEVIIIRPIGGG